MDRLLVDPLESSLVWIKDYLSRQPVPCEIKNFCDASARTADNAKLSQFLYFLRYGPAHLAEYYMCYRKLMNLDFLPETVRVVSIGCGCCLDYLSLALACENRQGSWKYLGIDPQQWFWYPRSHRMQLIQADFCEIDGNCLVDKNVFVFPKTFGLHETFQRMALKAIISQVCFCSSNIALIHSSYGQNSHTVEQIVQIFEQKGYKVRNRFNLDDYHGKPFQSLVHDIHHHPWSYPEHVQNQFIETIFSCRKRGECGDGCSGTDLYPVLRYETGSMRDDIVCFERPRSPS